jgi:hypothetical protein
MVEKEKDFLLFNYARESLARARARPPFQKEKKKITLADFLIKESPSHQRYCNESLTHK